MKLYLTISVGEAGLETAPIVASSDPDVVGAAVRALMKRLNGPVNNSRPVLQVVDSVTDPSFAEGAAKTVSPAMECVLQRLERAKRTRQGWEARCPAHDDSDPAS